MNERDTHPTRHQTETTKTTTNTEGTLTTELNRDQTERLITRGNQSEISTAEQVRRQGSELRLGVYPVGVHLHKTCELLSSEATVKINDGADGDELDGRTLIEPARKRHQLPGMHHARRKTYSEGMTSAIRSTPFCLDQRPTNTNRSASGSCLRPAHS